MRGITYKQKKFSDYYNKTGNGTVSALIAYNTDNRVTAGTIAYENLKKPQIRAYIESKAREAAEQIYNLSQNAEKEETKLKASQDILNRNGYLPVQKHENTIVKLDISDEQFNAIMGKYLDKLN